jgi:hypothetical protein
MATWTSLPAPARRALEFAGVFAIGCLVWWYCSAVVFFPVLRFVVEVFARMFVGSTLSSIAAIGDQWILNTQLLRSGSRSDLFDLPLEPRQFTLALPLVWAFSAVFATARRKLFVLTGATLIALLAMAVALVLQVVTTIPKFAINAKVVQYLGADDLSKPQILSYQLPNLTLLAIIDFVRVTTVYINLIILPVVVPAWLAARRHNSRPHTPSPQPRKKRRNRSR